MNRHDILNGTTNIAGALRRIIKQINNIKEELKVIEDQVERIKKGSESSCKNYY